MLSALISISLHDWLLQQSVVHVTAIYSSQVHLDAIGLVDVNVPQIKRCVDMNISAWHAGWARAWAKHKQDECSLRTSSAPEDDAYSHKS